MLTTAIGFAFALLLTTFSSVYTNKASSIREAKKSALQSFEDVAYNLEPLGEQYVQAELIQNLNLIAENRKVLLTNIAQQVAAAKKLEPYMDDPELVYTYMETVIRLREELIADRGVGSMKPYWAAKRDVVRARDAIVKPKS